MINLTEIFGEDSEISMKVEDNRLFICIVTSLSGEDACCSYERFLDAFWLDIPFNIRENVQIIIDFK